MDDFIKKGKPGSCPYCGSHNIEYDDSDHEDDWFVYYCHCNECDEDFKECFTMTFDGYYEY